MNVSVSVKFILQLCKQELGFLFQFPHDIKKEEEKKETNFPGKESLNYMKNKNFDTSLTCNICIGLICNICSLICNICIISFVSFYQFIFMKSTLDVIIN